MVSIININNGIEESTCGYQSTNQIVIFGGHVKVRECLCIRVIVWVNTILKHVDIRAIYRSMKVLTWYIDQNVIKIEILLFFHTLLLSKRVKSLL